MNSDIVTEEVKEIIKILLKMGNNSEINLIDGTKIELVKADNKIYVQVSKDKNKLKCGTTVERILCYYNISE